MSAIFVINFMNSCLTHGNLICKSSVLVCSRRKNTFVDKIKMVCHEISAYPIHEFNHCEKKLHTVRPFSIPYCLLGQYCS